MLYRAHVPQEGYCLELVCSDLAPADLFTDTAEQYRQHLRTLYTTDSRPFRSLIRQAQRDGLTLLSGIRPDLADVLYVAVVAVAAQQGTNVAGGFRGGEAVQRRADSLHANREDTAAAPWSPYR